MIKTSERFDLIKEDFKKIGKGAGIAVAGAIVTVLLEMIPSIDFGSYTVAVVAINSVICNAVLKWVSATKY
jgi:hypothetical protein